MTDFSERMRRVEDRLELRDLVARYAVAVDNHDFETLRPLFAPNGSFGRAAEATKAVRGRDEVIARMSEMLAKAGPSFHVIHDQILTFDAADPDRATGLVMCHAEMSSDRQHVAAIRYADRYLRHEGRWTFEERLLNFLYFVPLEDYPTILLTRDRMRDHAPYRAADWPKFA